VNARAASSDREGSPWGRATSPPTRRIRASVPTGSVLTISAMEKSQRKSATLPQSLRTSSPGSSQPNESRCPCRTVAATAQPSASSTRGNAKAGLALRVARVSLVAKLAIRVLAESLQTIGSTQRADCAARRCRLASRRARWRRSQVPTARRLEPVARAMSWSLSAGDGVYMDRLMPGWDRRREGPGDRARLQGQVGGLGSTSYPNVRHARGMSSAGISSVTVAGRLCTAVLEAGPSGPNHATPTSF
jgi:hypothetical protein